MTDDPLEAEDAYSDIIREGVILWWDRTMRTRASNPDTAAWVVTTNDCTSATCPVI